MKALRAGALAAAMIAGAGSSALAGEPSADTKNQQTPIILQPLGDSCESFLDPKTDILDVSDGCSNAFVRARVQELKQHYIVNEVRRPNGEIRKYDGP